MNQTMPQEKKKISPKVVVPAVILGVIAIIYMAGAFVFETHFMPGSTVNGVNCGMMTVDGTKKQLQNSLNGYTLTLTERGGKTETITAKDVELTYVDSGELQRLMDSQSEIIWPFYVAYGMSMTLSGDTTYNEQLLEEKLLGLDAMFQSNVVHPEDARLSVNNGDYQIVPEVEGNELDEAKLTAVVKKAMGSGVEDVDLDAEGCYLEPAIRADDPKLNEEFAKLSTWMNAEITFDFDDRSETADGSVIWTWITDDGNGSYDMDRDRVFDYVKNQLAYRYDTFGLTHTIHTHGGDTIVLKGGDYGWCIDRDKTTDKLMEAVKAGEKVTMEPDYKYSAMSRKQDDIGGTYVEISIKDQMMWCYEDYKLVVETPVVTGCVEKGNDTPSGSVWAVDAMKRDAVLGTMDTMGYESPVKYWIPFTGNVGIHDADGWRKEYGGDIYLKHGSHGCVNTPTEAAGKIYETVKIGTAIIVY